MRLPVTALLIALFVRVGTSLPGAEPETLTVCEVLQKLESLNGKEVAIRGELYGGDHGHCLLPAEKCPSERRRDSYVWRNEVHLVYPPPGKYDREAYEAQQRRIRDALGGEPGSRFRVIITFVGRLKTKWNEVYRMPDGSYLGGGFGFSLASPAELTIVTSRDIEVHRIEKESEAEAKPKPKP